MVYKTDESQPCTPQTNNAVYVICMLIEFKFKKYIIVSSTDHLLFDKPNNLLR